MVNDFKTYLFVLITSVSLYGYAQEKINWMSFEELESAQKKEPKKILLYFHADWCVYCKKMDRKVFTDPELIKLLSNEYYAVRFDAESEAKVKFGGKTYTNEEVGKSRTPLHQITMLLATREGEFVAPTLVLLTKDFKIAARYFEYMTSSELMALLK